MPIAVYHWISSTYPNDSTVKAISYRVSDLYVSSLGVDFTPVRFIVLVSTSILPIDEAMSTYNIPSFLSM